MDLNQGKRKLEFDRETVDVGTLKIGYPHIQALSQDKE
jgi:hypothetical protein